MDRVILGDSGLSVSPIAYGTWQLSPRFWGEQSKSDAIAAMKLAFDKGINFFDTAEAYGDGYAETVLGEAIKELPRDEIVVVTKVFNHFNPDKTRYPDLSPEHIAMRCDMSLKRMGVDCIDLYLLHMFDPLTPFADVAGALEELKKQGKVKNVGVSNYTLEQFKGHRKFGPYNVIQPPYSFVEPVGEADMLPYCQSENIGVMIYSPMHKGLLTGKYKGDETFDDFRANHPDFTGDRFKELCDKVQSLRPLAEKYGVTLYQLILAATLMHPAIQVAICGIKTPAQIEEAVGAAGTVLSREDYFKVRNAVGPGSPRIKDASGTRK